ncbi:hypothetical protein DXV76_12780 [Rhodobacteraceae bacterium CCMM004]|nr:hypothetical protein DXV76_12780 [Rhodobacteraceae bacterium CCMM004]
MTDADVDADTPLARLRASPPRRAFGTGVLGLLGLLLIWLAVTAGPTLPWRLVLLALGGGALAGAIRVWQATKATLLLYPHGLVDSDGRVVAEMDEIKAVDRGMFAFKPSNGFLMTLTAPAGRAWAPGLWWRVGRRVGVGGVTSSAEARAMADVLSVLIARRDGGLRT